MNSMQPASNTCPPLGGGAEGWRKLRRVNVVPEQVGMCSNVRA